MKKSKRKKPSAAVLIARYEKMITQHAQMSPKESYIARQLDEDREKRAKKLGEEIAEAAIASMKNDDEQLTGEAADVLHRLLIVLQPRGITLADVAREMLKKHKEDLEEDK